MKNKILRNAVLTFAVSSLIAIPVFGQNISPILAKDLDLVPISHVFNHWAEGYLEQLSIKYDVEEIFKDKNLDDYIVAEDFKNAIKQTIDNEYANEPKDLTRETIVYEFTKIWSEKTGKDLESLPITKMLIYSDTSTIDIEYQHGIYVAYMYDIAKGRETGMGRTFDPKTNLTYGELVVLINNTAKAIEKELASPPIVEGSYETKGNYQIKDGKVIFDFELVNHYTEAQELAFGSGKQFELTITAEEGEEVYKYSDGKFFTMALVYKTLNPGESLKWQDEWDMTNKEGEKLSEGNFKAEIEILVIREEDDVEIDPEQLTTVISFTLNDKDIVNSETAKEIIAERAEELLKAIKDKDGESIAGYVHPVKGIRFTPYTTVSIDNHLVFSKEDMTSFFEDEGLYIWGNYDGSGDEIELSKSQYYESFIYSEDFLKAPEIGYNEVLVNGNMIENQFELYENPIVVEYHIPEINPEYGGLDWQSLRLVFEEYEGNWKLVGIIHNQWTI